MKVATRRLLEEQIAVVIVLECGKKDDAMWHVPHLDPYGGTDPLGMFPLFLKRTADVMAPRLSVVFRRPARLGSNSWLAGDRPMSPQFRKVHHRLLLPITDQFQ